MATMSLEMANNAMFKPYDSGELIGHGKLDDRLEELRKQIWVLRNTLVNVTEGLDIEADKKDLTPGALEERYNMGLMSQEEEIEYLFDGKEIPF